MISDKHSFLLFRTLSVAGISSAILISIALGQTKKNLTKNKIDIEIYGGQNNNLYTNGSNLISILTKDTSTTFTVKSSQGIIRQLDKYMFFVDSLQKGEVAITILKSQSEKFIPVITKTYNVLVPKIVTKYNALSVSPDISIGGFTNGKVKLDSLKKITSLSINKNYTILAATFYIGMVDFLSTSIKSKYFDKNLLEVWKRIGPNCTISIDNIEFMDKTGNRYYYPKPLTVTTVE